MPASPCLIDPGSPTRVFTVLVIVKTCVKNRRLVLKSN